MKKIIEKIYSGEESEFYETISNILNEKQQKIIITANPEILMHSLNDESIYNNLNSDKSLITADGISIVKTFNKLFDKQITRITGVDIVGYLLDKSTESNYKVLIYGTNDQILTKLNNKLIDEGKSIDMELINGFDYDIEHVLKRITIFKPNIVIVPQGVPRQEKIIFEISQSTNNILYIGCGGAIDVLSGHVKRAPKIVQLLSLEWLYRIIRQPSRIKRFFENQIKFIVYIYENDMK